MAMQLDVRHGLVLRRPEGEEVATVPQRSVLIKADLDEIGVTESWYGSAQDGANLHIHRRHADSFYVLDGELRFLTATGSLNAPAGATFVAPPGVVHGFASETEARFLNLHTPGCEFVESLRARRNPETYDRTRYDSHDPPEDAPSGATISYRGDGDRLENEKRVATIKIGRDELALLEFELNPGFEGPRPHIHKRHVDSFYVVEGAPQFLVGDTVIEGEPGMFVSAPPGVVHAFSNPGPGRARLVNVHAPSCDFHEYMHVMASSDDIDDATHARYDQYTVA